MTSACPGDVQGDVSAESGKATEVEIPTPDPNAPGLRLDKWLWHARFCKTRSLAQKLSIGGHVKRDGVSLTKPASLVRPGDRLTLLLGPVRRTVMVLALGTRRGPAPEAQALYHEPDPPQRINDPMADGPGPLPRSGRPGKRDRRALQRLKDPFSP